MKIHVTLDDGTLVDTINLDQDEAEKIVGQEEKNSARRIVFFWTIQWSIKRALNVENGEEERRKDRYRRIVEGDRWLT